MAMSRLARCQESVSRCPRRSSPPHAALGRRRRSICRPLRCPRAHKLRTQVAIREPLASLELDSQRILVRTGPKRSPISPARNGPDRLPTLIQTRLVQTFQNASFCGSVGRAGGGFSPNYSLELDIRAFELDAKRVRRKVDIAAKIVDDRGGRIVARGYSRCEVPAAGTGGAQASAR